MPSDFKVVYVSKPMPWLRDKKMPFKGWWKTTAKRLRKDRTPAESALCHHLRNRRRSLLGIAWRFQKPFYGRIPDFHHSHFKMIVEADGRHHKSQYKADLERDKVFALKGFLVMRFPNDLCTGNTMGVLAEIEDEMLLRAQQRHSREPCRGSIRHYIDVEAREPRFIGDRTPLMAFGVQDFAKKKLRKAGQAEYPPAAGPEGPRPSRCGEVGAGPRRVLRP